MEAHVFSHHDTPSFWAVTFFIPNSTCHLASLDPKQTASMYVPLVSALCFSFKILFLQLLASNPCLDSVSMNQKRPPGSCAWHWVRTMGRWTQRPSNSWTSFLTQVTCPIPWDRCICILAGIVAALRTAADNILPRPKETVPLRQTQQFQPLQTCFQIEYFTL